MSVVYLGLGSNLGDRRGNIYRAVELIADSVGTVVRMSSLYDTEPWGFSSDNMFVNAAVCVETRLTPREVLVATQTIERRMGRIEKSVGGQYHDRVIDIDILMYDDRIVNERELTIPHKEMHKRMFVLEPLEEIAPYLMHPLLQKTVTQLKETLEKELRNK